jgi:uncharacterized protein (TIGR02757 family)
VQEYVALVSGLMAFGGVKQILTSVRKLSARLDLKSSSMVLSLPVETLAEKLEGFTHRVYVGRDLALLTSLYQESRKRHGSLAHHFLAHHDASNETIEQALAGVITDYKNWANESLFKPGAHFKHMLNSPEQGSTCKRWLMYLKWMIRKDDGIDLGLWSEHSSIRPDQLLIPLDTHLYKISKKLGLTQKNTPNFKMSIEVTRALKKTDPLDPTRFDFSLCRFGMFDYRKILSSIENDTLES